MYLQKGSFGKPIATYTRFKLLEDSTKPCNVDAVIYSGRPVTLNADGEVVPVTANKTVYGLAKSNKNQYIDEVFDPRGMYGSGKIAVVVLGIVDVYHNIYTLQDGTEVKIDNFDTAQTYNVMDPLYVELTNEEKIGIITNVTDENNDKTFLGYVLEVGANKEFLQILLCKPTA
ncbi:MAG: hypothetical protein QXD72_02400 [Candidatus Aenigmatarchaeota archaeon]